MSRAASPFSPGKLLLVVLVGAGSFLLFLYAIGAGWTGDQSRVTTAHANSNALNGYTALVDLLERRGQNVEVARDRLMREEEVLLILTPGLNTDPAELEELMASRRYYGPTLVILPKWMSGPLPQAVSDENPSDWVQVGQGYTPMWFEQVESFEPLELGVGGTRGWKGLGFSGTLPDPEYIQAVTDIPARQLFPLITDTEGDVLAGYWNRNGFHPYLADAAGIPFSDHEEYSQDEALYPLVIVAEPDLLNNYGMSDIKRAQAAVRLVELSMDGFEYDIVFDMTLPGFGSAENLLTLAFRPPFLAATLCLLFAFLVVGWRAFRRFGPPVAEDEVYVRGKTQLARNGAALIERTRRWHLLGAPYATLVANRIADMLHIRAPNEEAREQQIDAHLARYGMADTSFREKAQALRNARGPAEMIRAASALKAIERMLKR